MPDVSDNNTPRADDRARQIVNYVLDVTARAGRIEGRKPDRVVTFPVIVTVGGIEQREMVDALTDAAQRIIDGTATYRPRASARANGEPERTL